MRRAHVGRSCSDGVIQAPAPHRLIEGGLPTEALVADVLVSKHADHLPFYRQAQTGRAKAYGSIARRCALGRLRGFRAGAAARSAREHPEDFDEALRRRDALPSSRSGAWQNENRLSVASRRMTDHGVAPIRRLSPTPMLRDPARALSDAARRPLRCPASF
jgi:hypothetical protein